MATSTSSVELYRKILRAGRGFPDYNVRSYIIRRAKTDFQRNKALQGDAAKNAIAAAVEQLALIQRQSTIAGFYQPPEPSVMEVLEQRKKSSSSSRLQ